MAEKKSVSVKVYNMAGEEVSKMNLNAEVFGIEPHQQAMFDAVQVEQANQRQATAKTKVRHEVSGGEQSSDQLEIKTSRFPKTKKNINLRSSPR